MARTYFQCTESARAQITSLFDFIWPTAAAMWNLRWQVQGFIQVSPNASQADLEARFLRNSNIHGANLKKSCVQQSWDQQLEIFSSILLTYLFATYESWISAVLKTLGHASQALEKELQFPTHLRSGKQYGVREAVAKLTSVESKALLATLYPKLKQHSKYSEPVLDNLLLCYRYFKELRNSLIHRGGIADAKAELAYQEFAPIANAAGLGLPEVPVHGVVTQGGRVTLKLRGVVGFSDVVNRLIITLDAELARAAPAEKELTRRWREGLNKRFFVLPADARRRRKKIARLLDNLKFPKPIIADDSIETVLRNAKLIA